MPTGVTRRRRRLRAGDSALAAGTVATRPPAQDLERARRFHAGKPGLQPAETHRTACATSAEAETSRYSTPRAEPRVSIPRWAGSCLLGDVLRPSAANFFVATAGTPLVILARAITEGCIPGVSQTTGGRCVTWWLPCGSCWTALLPTITETRVPARSWRSVWLGQSLPRCRIRQTTLDTAASGVIPVTRCRGPCYTVGSDGSDETRWSRGRSSSVNPRSSLISVSGRQSPSARIRSVSPRPSASLSASASIAGHSPLYSSAGSLRRHPIWVIAAIPRL